MMRSAPQLLQQLQLLLLLLLLVAAIAVVVSALLLTRRRQATEAFTLAREAHSSLRGAYLSSACTELASPDLQGNALVKAKEHVDTQRLRRWKPLDAPPGDGKVTHCFAMYSPSGSRAKLYSADGLGPSDYFMAGRTCDKSDPAFASVPFIKRVFEDTGAQTVNAMGQRKCVMEIEPGAIQPQALQAFWDQVADTDCTRKNQSLLELRTRLRSDLEDQRQLRAQLQLLVRDQLADLEALARDIAGLRRKQADARQQEDKSQAAYDTQLQRVHDLKGAYAAVDAQKKTELSVSSKAHHACSMDKQRLESEVQSAQAAMDQLAQTQQGLQELYDNQSKDLSSEEATSQRVTAAYNAVSDRLGAASGDLAKCKQASLECQESLGVCKGQLDQLSAVKAQLDKDFAALSFRLRECKKLQASEREELTRLTELDRRLQRDTAALALQEAEAQRELKRQAARLESLYAELEELKKLQTSCAGYEEQLAALRRKLAELQSKCNAIHDRVDKMRKESLADQMIQNLRVRDEKCVEKPPPPSSFYDLVATSYFGAAFVPRTGADVVEWAKQFKFRASAV